MSLRHGSQIIEQCGDTWIVPFTGQLRIPKMLECIGLEMNLPSLNLANWYLRSMVISHTQMICFTKCTRSQLKISLKNSKAHKTNNQYFLLYSMTRVIRQADAESQISRRVFYLLKRRSETRRKWWSSPKNLQRRVYLTRRSAQPASWGVICSTDWLII